MGQLTIYDSEGNEYGHVGRGRQNQRISNFFFSGVRVAIDLSGQPELIVFFRAKESNTGRSEQFYAVYQDNSPRNLLPNFKSDLERWAREQEMTLVTDMDDVQVYRELTEDGGDPPGDDIQHTVLSHILEKGEQARVGVNDHINALSLFQNYSQNGAASRIAIAEESGGSGLNDYDLVIETGRYRGLEPLGETQQRFQRAQGEVEDQIISETIEDIQSKVQDLQRKTSASDSKIRRQLKSRLRVLDSPATGSSRMASSNDSIFDNHTKVVAVAGVVLIVLAAAVAAATMLGPLSIFGFGDGGGDDGLAASTNSSGVEFSVNQIDHSLQVNGTTEEDVVTVAVYKNGDMIDVYRDEEREDGPIQAAVSNNTFNESIIPAETGELTVSVSPNGTQEFATNSTINYTGAPTPTLTARQTNTSTSGDQSGDEILVNVTADADTIVLTLSHNDSVLEQDSVQTGADGSVEVYFGPYNESGNITVSAAPYGQEEPSDSVTINYTGSHSINTTTSNATNSTATNSTNTTTPNSPTTSSEMTSNYKPRSVLLERGNQHEPLR